MPGRLPDGDKDRAPERGIGLIPWMIGTAAVAGVGIGWYGHKAGLRIAAWGLRADEQDLIFQQMSEGEEEGRVRTPTDRRMKEPPMGAILANPKYSAAAVISK